MEQSQIDKERTKRELKIIFVAELFSKLSNEKQDKVISQIKALLLHE